MLDFIDDTPAMHSFSTGMCYHFHRGDDHIRVVSSVVFMKGKSIKELEFVHATWGSMW